MISPGLPADREPWPVLSCPDPAPWYRRSQLPDITESAWDVREGIEGHFWLFPREADFFLIHFLICCSIFSFLFSALADTAMGKKALHIPYRDSVLTTLLQSALGGNSRTTLVKWHSYNFTDWAVVIAIKTVLSIPLIYSFHPHSTFFYIGAQTPGALSTIALK